MDLKKLLGALTLLMFLIGGIACSSSEEEEIVTDGAEEVISEESDYSDDDFVEDSFEDGSDCLLYTSPSPRDRQKSRMPSSA